MRIVGLILAGGEGKRLGVRDKALVDLAGQPLIARAVTRLAPQVQAVAVSANGDPSRLAPFGLPVIADGAFAGQGPLAGLLAGLDWAVSVGAGALVTVAVDTPFFPEDLVSRLMQGADHAGGTVAQPVLAESVTGLHPTFALWPVGALAPLAEALGRGERRIRAFAGSRQARVVHFQGDPDPFFNINTAGDLAEATRRMRSAGTGGPAS